MNKVVFEAALRSSRAFELIRNDIMLGPGHAYMIVSPDDEITAEFFTLVAATLFCGTRSACFECAECNKVVHGNHPDVVEINAAGEKIKVQDIRELTQSVSIKSLSGGKAYFVYRADLMNTDAQNKLLKTLEEPPRGVTIFLGSANEAAMLDTVKSRCRKINVDVFDRDVVYEALIALGCSPDAAAIAAACSEGELGKARRIALSPEYGELYRDTLRLAEGLNKSGDVLTFDTLPSLVKNPTDFLTVLSIVFRDMLAFRKNEKLMFSSHMAQRIGALAEGYSAPALAKIIFEINEARRKLSLGINANAVIDSLLFTILEVRYKWQ